MFKIPDEIVYALPRNKLVIFVGSGFSKPLDFLDWNQLALKAISEYETSKADVGLLRECLKKNILSEILVFDALKDLDKHKILEIVKANNNINIDIFKLENQKRLWKISDKIITTNYDKAIETVKPNPSVEVISHDHLFEVGKSLKKETWLFHIHGMVDNINKCVIFSEDYYKLYSAKHPAIEQLKSIALHNTILFIGFSMKDKYVAKLFEDLNLIFSDTPSSEHFILLEENEQVSSKHLKKISIESYSKTAEYLDLLIASKEASLECLTPIQGNYLRRRCRTFEHGSDDFNNIMIELCSEELPEEGRKHFEERIEFLVGYEKVIATSAMYENFGETEMMVKILSENSFQGKQESIRLLFLAIGYEKLGKVKSAISVNEDIIKAPDADAEISLCAKFNLCICEEKFEKYGKVYFDKFISYTTTLKFTKERIKDKAISNHLIVCEKRQMKFDFETEYKESVEYEAKNKARGLIKTLINYLSYKHQSISREKYYEIINLAKGRDTSSRIAVFCRLIRLIEKDTLHLLKGEVLENVTTLYNEFPSEENKKYLTDLIEFINDQNQN